MGARAAAQHPAQEGRRKGSGRGRDQQRWGNDYFTKLGLFDLEEIIGLRQADNY